MSEELPATTGPDVPASTAPAPGRRPRSTVDPRPGGSRFRRGYALLVGNAVTMGFLALIAGFALGIPLQDPDGFLGPGWLRLPSLLAGAFVADIVPRVLYRSRFRFSRFRAETRAAIDQHWSRERVILVVVGVVSFYVVYVSYRNLKNFLPFLRSDGDGPPIKYDLALHRMDEWLFFGSDPSQLLHTLLGTGIAAHVLSFAYLLYLPIVPVSIVAWAVWSRNISFGYWFITAQCLAWSLGTLSYYVVPTLGPNFFFPWLYTDLPDTGVAQLQDALFYGRQNVRFNPFADGVQSVAGFASLHVAITVVIALVGQYTLKTRGFRIALWGFVGVTVIATIYFGWHYIADDIAGALIAVVSVYIAGLATGQRFDRLLRTSRPTTVTGTVPLPADSVRSGNVPRN